MFDVEVIFVTFFRSPFILLLINIIISFAMRLLRFRFIITNALCAHMRLYNSLDRFILTIFYLVCGKSMFVF